MQKKIRVAIFVDGDFIPSYDGASNRFHYLSRYLAMSGVEVIVFHGYRGWSDISLIRKEPFKTYVFPIDTYYKNLGLLSTLLVREGVDLIQFDNLEPILLQGVALSRMSGIRLVSEMHYVVRDLARRLGADPVRLAEIQSIEQEVGKSIDHLICLSELDKPLLENNLEIDPMRISVIPSGVDCSEIRYFGPDIKERNIIFLGNLYFKPNEDAVCILKEKIYPTLRNHGFRFTIGGDCPPSLKERLEEDDFLFTGVLPDLNSLFNTATFALAPIEEGTGMRIKLLNYLAAGIPIVTTDIATNGFAVKEHFYIENDYEKYADLMLRLVKDTDALRAITVKGRSFVEKYFDWRIIARDTTRVYESILSRPIREKEVVRMGVLKTHEPVWLQEAVAKNRFKQIENEEIGGPASFWSITRDVIKPYAVRKIIAFEGMPGAGKTTLIEKLSHRRGAAFLPQLQIADAFLEKDDVATSIEFLRADEEKSSALDELSETHPIIFLDRTFLSTLAYAYARSKMKGATKEYEQVLGFYRERRHTIALPTEIIFFDIVLEKSIERRIRFAEDDRYSNWFNPTFLRYLKEFYVTELPDICKIKVSTIDTTHLSVEEIEKIICGIID